MKKKKKYSELSEPQREARRETNRLYYHRNRELCRERYKERIKRLKSNWPSCRQAYQRKAALKSYRKMSSEPQRKARYLELKRAWEKKQRQEKGEIVKQYARDWHAKLKQEVMNGYGGCCSCCGESEIAFLTIDHVDGDGTERRKHGEPLGTQLYAMLKKAGYPTGYQALCWNCNLAKHHRGECPHQTNAKRFIYLVA